MAKVSNARIARDPRARHIHANELQLQRHHKLDAFAALKSSERATNKICVEPPPRLISLPDGTSFDLGRAARGVSAILEAQGVSAESLLRGATDNILFLDADLTLFQAPPRAAYLKHKETGERLIDPKSERVVQLGVGPGRDESADYAALKEGRRDFDPAAYQIDYRDLEAVSNVLSATPILPTIAALKKANADPRSKQLIITARSGQDEVIKGLGKYSDREGVRTDGILMMYHPRHQTLLGIDQVRSQALKKALSMAAVLHLLDPALTKAARVRFVDDNDDNLKVAMQLLPALFPNTRFEFVDVVHRGEGRFKHQLIGKSRDGVLKDSAGRALAADRIAAYRSKDAPFEAMPEAIDLRKRWPMLEKYVDQQDLGEEKQILRALREKFSKHTRLKKDLLSTGNAMLINSSSDRYWGDGGNGSGKNQLGHLLMLVRAELGYE